MTTMHRSRIMAFVSSLLLSGLVLVTSGFVCESTSIGGASMSSMDMNASQHRGTTDSPSVPGVPPAPCKLPRAPGGCTSMVPCSQSAVAATGISIEPLFEIAQSTFTMVAIAPPSETPAPELPPPRA